MAQMPYWLTNLEQFFAQGSQPFAVYLSARIIMALALAAPPAFVLGLVLPTALSWATARATTAARDTGWLLASSTVGSIAGTVLCGCVSIPQMIPLPFPFQSASGIQDTIVTVALIQIALSLILLYRHSRGSLQGAQTTPRPDLLASCPPTALTMLGIALLVLHPPWQPIAMSSGVSFLSLPDLGSFKAPDLKRLVSFGDLLFYKEGVTSTVTVGQVATNNIIYLKNDGKMEAALPLDPAKPAPTSDEPTEVLLAVIPQVVAPQEATRAFLVGYGSGTTAGALLSFRALNSLTIAELEPSVYAADRFFNKTNNRPLRQDWQLSGRSQAAVADARSLLSLCQNTYDLIVSQPAEPWVEGSTDLYSLEFWQLARSRLTKHGVFCQWIQLYAIDPPYLAVVLRTFNDVFANVALFHQRGAGELIIVGFNDDADAFDAKSAGARLANNPAVRAQLARLGIGGVGDVLATKIGDKSTVARLCLDEAAHWARTPRNTDNNLFTEYALPAQLLAKGDCISSNLAALGIDENLSNERHVSSSVPGAKETKRLP
jgi:spermidine synthase